MTSASTETAAKVLLATAALLAELSSMEHGARQSARAKQRARRRVEFILDEMEDHLDSMRDVHALFAGGAILHPRDRYFAHLRPAARAMVAQIASEPSAVSLHVLAELAPDQIERFRHVVADALEEALEIEAFIDFFSGGPNGFEFEGRTFCFREPIALKLGREPEGWTIAAERFGVLEHGRTFREVWEAWRMHLAADWDDIALAPDEQLTADARELKAVLLSAVERVSP